MNDKHMAKLFWGVKAALVAILLYVAIGAVITPFQLDTGLKPKAVSGDERLQDETMVETAPPTPPDYSVILDNDVFGGSGQSTEPDDSLADNPAPAILPSAEKLGLTLRGIIAGGPATSRAIIEDAKTKLALPYKIGDRVGPATIESIEPERVILLHAGHKAVLQMHPGSAAQNTTEKLEPITARPPATSQLVTQPSARLGYVEELFRKATIEPFMKDGHAEGLKITGFEETPLTKMFGLRNGDVVQTVNGQNINSKQKAFQVLKKARTQPEINLQLLRDGKSKELSFDL